MPPWGGRGTCLWHAAFINPRGLWAGSGQNLDVSAAMMLSLRLQLALVLNDLIHDLVRDGSGISEVLSPAQA